jgi:hypothetical protein
MKCCNGGMGGFTLKRPKNFVQEITENFVQGMNTPCTKFFELIGVHLAQFVPNDVLIL